MRLIGMVHLKALPGYPQHKGMQHVIAHALADALALARGGADAILVENTDDDPHQKTVGPETVAAFTAVMLALRNAVDLPLGVCVLWNDAKAALAIAKVTDAAFVRIPVYTEAVLTSCGMIEGNPYETIRYRECIGAQSVRILADVHVKHATVISKRAIEQSAAEALHFGADEVIITGDRTGDPPDIEQVMGVSAACAGARINIGSGMSAENAQAYAPYIDAMIVGTSLKTDGRIDREKVRTLRSAVN